MEIECTHLDQIQEVTPSADGCEDCLKIGDEWWTRRLLRFVEEQARH